MDGECDCLPSQACATALENQPGGLYPRTVHRCVDVPDECGAAPRCECLPVDPCWEPQSCQGLVRGDKVHCGFDVMSM